MPMSPPNPTSIRSLPKFKAGDSVHLSWLTDNERINSIATVSERLTVSDLGYAYRLIGYPGLHVENTLSKPTVEDLKHHTEATLEPPLDVAALRSKDLFAFDIGEVVQVDDVDEIDDVAPVSFCYGIISAMGLDDEGVYYVVGLKNQDGEFVDSGHEFVEDELIRLTADEQERHLRPPANGSHLTLASSR